MPVRRQEGKRTNAAWIATFMTRTLNVSNVMCGMRSRLAGSNCWETFFFELFRAPVSDTEHPRDDHEHPVMRKPVTMTANTWVRHRRLDALLLRALPATCHICPTLFGVVGNREFKLVGSSRRTRDVSNVVCEHRQITS